MIKVIFLCHGNICRSPMAEFIMKDILAKKGIASEFYITSAAVSTEEIGNPIYPPAKRKLAEHGISTEGHHARQVRKNEYKEYDYLIGMDSSNIRNMKYIFGGDPDGKIYKLLYFAGLDRDISDPWYTGDFERTWQDIRLGCTKMLEKIKKAD